MVEIDSEDAAFLVVSFESRRDSNAGRVLLQRTLWILST